jgi:hypothetical protein
MEQQREQKKEPKGMKNSILIRGLAPLAVCALLLPTAASAQTTSFTATGWVDAVLSPGIVCTNALGQVLIRGTVHTQRIQSTDARVTGQLLSIGDASYNADGTANVQGTAYLQVGTWDANTNFTATGGMWEGIWSGVMQTNYDLQLSIAGYGSGGTIDGWRLAETLIRTNASALIDTNVPCLYTGTVKPPPVSTDQVVDNFDNNLLSWGIWGWGTAKETNQMLTLRGYYPGVHTRSLLGESSVGVYPGRFWTVPSGMTFEWSVDLVSLDASATNLVALAVGSDSGGKYFFYFGHDLAFLAKWSTSDSGRASVFTTERVQVRTTNVVLALALTPVSSGVVVAGRVLDKADPSSVLYQCSFFDTPLADPTINSNQFQALTGMSVVTLGLDPGATNSLVGADVWLFLGQYTDGTQPAVVAVFDNVELRTYEVPTVSVQRAVQVTWPDPTGVYVLEAAPTVQGPFLPAQELALPGIQNLTVPASGPAQFFRVLKRP